MKCSAAIGFSCKTEVDINTRPAANVGHKSEIITLE